MRILLDTNALIWMFSDSDRLGQGARAFIRNRENEIIVSVVSFWEIALKARSGKLQLDTGAFIHFATRGGLRRLDIEAAHLTALQSLPKISDHRDPFDHLLIAQAIAEGATILTADHRFPHYRIRCLPCDDRPFGPTT